MRALTVARTPQHMGSLLLFGALAMAALVMINRPRDVVVLFPRDGLIAALPEGTEILRSSPTELVLGGARGLTEALYAAGATIVLSARRGGCSAPTLP